MGLFDRLLRIFQGIRVKPLPLKIEVDLDDSGQYQITFFKELPDGREQIKDVHQLLDYGYREVSKDGRTVYRLMPYDRQALLALKSLNPVISPDGFVTSQVVPSILKYWRAKRSIQETEKAKTLKINDKPLAPTARIDFDPKKGLDIKIGYREEESEQVLPADQLQPTADSDYVRIGNTFTRLPQKLSAAAENLLQIGSRFISIHGVPEFFLRDLVLIRKEFNAVLTDLASQIKIIEEPVQPVLRVSSDEKGWLDFEVSYQAGGLSIPHNLLAKQKDKKHFQVNSMTWLTNNPAAIEKTTRELEKLEAIPIEGGYRVPAARFASLEEFIQELGGQAELSASYRAFLDQLIGFNADESFRLPDEIEQRLKTQGIVLRPYQRAGIHWLQWLHQTHLHGVLADDMGLGKTIQTISTMRHAYENTGSRQHSLVVAPKSVLVHWEREIKRCYPKIYTYRYVGPGRRRDHLGLNFPIIFITTYATLANDYEQFAAIPLFYLVLDEATRIKNPNAKRTQAVKALNAAHRLALSGTPVENRPAELWSLFDFLMRGHLGRYGTFTRRFETAISNGDTNAAKELGKRVRPFLLRRLKEDVAKDLPEKIDINEWCELSEEQRQLYGSLQDEAKRIRDALLRDEHVNYTSNILPVITKLKQICDHPALITKEWNPIMGRSEKFDWIIDRVEEIYANGEQVVIFSHFLDMLSLLQRALNEKGISLIRIDGSTKNRQSLIDHFNQGRAKVALLSIMAAGHGINMTSANHVIHADRWWNPAVEDQATDRVHRIGQSQTVYVHRILTEGTLEERIDRLLEKKRNMADQIVGAAVSGPRAWTREELIELLQPLDSVVVRKSRDGKKDTAIESEHIRVIKKPILEDKPLPHVVQPMTTNRKELDSLHVVRPHTITESASKESRTDRRKRVLGLGKRRSPSAVQELVSFLSDPDDTIRWLAGSSLVKIGDSYTISTLLAFLNNKATPEARQQAVKVLGQIGASQARLALERIADDGDEDKATRDAAETALLMLDK
ncbi:MAG: HEAT repeat domain-containing protein [Anaerolineales bacterium]|nr:HEAT repeat domain-containing protein [Anaerolineales bacterium]